MAYMTLPELLDRLPPELQGWGQIYGPALLTLAKQQLLDILALLLAGDTKAPYKAALEVMTGAQLDAETAAFTASDAAHAEANAANVAAQKKAATTAATIIFSIILGMVGL